MYGRVIGRMRGVKCWVASASRVATSHPVLEDKPRPCLGGKVPFVGVVVELALRQPTNLER